MYCEEQQVLSSQPDTVDPTLRGMDVIPRLHAAVKASGLSKKEVAGRAKMTPFRLSRLLNGRSKRADLHAIEAVLAAIGKSMEDLYTGEPSHDVRHALRVLTEYVDTRESPPVAALALSAPAIRQKKRISRIVSTFDVAANPNAILLDSAETTRKKVPPELWNRHARRGVRVVGDSMIDAGIHEGDVVFFVPEVDRRAARDRMVVIRVNAAVFLKYYHEADGKKLLVSARPGLAPMVLNPGEDVELYGVVVLPPPLDQHERFHRRPLT
jgi:SOS-response transcriptional repressor LexA